MSMRIGNGFSCSGFFLAALLAAAAAAGLPGMACGPADSSPRSASEEGEASRATWSDTGLELRVKTALLQKLKMDGMGIRVQARDGKVDLGGVVGSRASRELAVEVALSVEGVSEVESEISLEPAQVESGTPLGDAMGKAEGEVRDAILESRVKLALLDQIGGQALDLEVEATAGVVSLRGTLPRKEHRKLALKTVKEMPGVEKVIDLIEVGKRE